MRRRRRRLPSGKGRWNPLHHSRFRQAAEKHDPRQACGAPLRLSARGSRRLRRMRPPGRHRGHTVCAVFLWVR